MRSVYKVVAFVIAAEVALQAMAMVFAIAGMYRWVNDGGVLDKAAMENGEPPFAEGIGFLIHAMNGMMVIPALALILLIVSFFAKVPGGVKWAGAVFLLVALQVTLGLLGHSIPAAGALHGLNALLLFSAAVYTGLRSRKLGTGDESQPVPAQSTVRQTA